jgi:transcriptional regulator with XRE-family HTH domain
MDSAVMAQYATKELGIPLLIHKSVHQKTCKHCGQVSHFIPYPDRLIAAAAISRAQIAVKLNGSEIRFLRKALNKSAKDLANDLGVVAETFSRWENDHAPMSPAIEKMLRIRVGVELAAQAPAIDFRADEVINMHIEAVRGDPEDVLMAFELIRFKNAVNQPTTDAYTQEQRKVA